MSTSTPGQSFRHSLEDAERETLKSALLAHNWWATGLRGLAAIIFGLIAIFLPGATILSLVLVFAAYVLVDGVAGIIAAVRAAREGEAWAFLAFAGVVNVAAGILAAVWPAITVLAFVVIAGVSEIISGALTFGSAFQLKEDHGRWWLAFGGILSFFFGLFLILAPLFGAVVLTWWLGIYAIGLGVVLLILAFKLRAKHIEHPTFASPQGA